jgi:hypothetical protein
VQLAVQPARVIIVLLLARLAILDMLIMLLLRLVRSSVVLNSIMCGMVTDVGLAILAVESAMAPLLISVSAVWLARVTYARSIELALPGAMLLKPFRKTLLTVTHVTQTVKLVTMLLIRTARAASVSLTFCIKASAFNLVLTSRWQIM